MSLTLLPMILRHWAPPRPPATPEVLMLRFRERMADVDAASHNKHAQDTPLLGRFESAARDRSADSRDTQVPAGAELSSENSLPGTQGEAGPGAAGAAAAAQARGLPPDPAGAGIADALGPEVAMLTGKSQPAPRRGGHGARHEADLGEGGALEFGDYSFSTRAWDYEPYWAYMRERLYANWHPPAAYKDYGIIRGGWTLVRAVLDRQGRLIDAHIVGENGHASLHPASLAAMLGAAPFRPLPQTFPDDSLVVTVRFIYLPPGETHAPDDWR